MHAVFCHRAHCPHIVARHASDGVEVAFGVRRARTVRCGHELPDDAIPAQGNSDYAVTARQRALPHHPYIALAEGVDAVEDDRPLAEVGYGHFRPTARWGRAALLVRGDAGGEEDAE